METTPSAELPVSGARRPSLWAETSASLVEPPQDEALRSIYLERLQRALRLRRRHNQDLNAQGLQLLDRSIFTAYCDCRDVGAGEEARRILREAEFVVDQPTMPFGRPDTGLW